VTTADAKRFPSTGIKGFFTIYKPGQGKWVRWGTVVAVGVVTFGAAVTVARWELANAGDVNRAIGGAVVVLLGALLAFWLVNSPKMAEFLIATESEMRKVSWPSRREVANSTKVVILLTFILGILLFMVDIGFLDLFKWMGIA